MKNAQLYDLGFLDGLAAGSVKSNADDRFDHRRVCGDDRRSLYDTQHAMKTLHNYKPEHAVAKAELYECPIKQYDLSVIINSLRCALGNHDIADDDVRHHIKFAIIAAQKISDSLPTGIIVGGKHIPQDAFFSDADIKEMDRLGRHD